MVPITVLMAIIIGSEKMATKIISAGSQTICVGLASGVCVPLVAGGIPNVS